MSFVPIRLSILGGTLLLIAGCGGSTGGGSAGGGLGGGGGTGGGNPATVTYTFTGGAPAAVATKIGSGGYTQATLESGKLSISVPSGTTDYSVAWACPATTTVPSPSNSEYVVQASTLDGTSYSENCANSTSPPWGLATLQVDASAIPGAAYVYIWGSGWTLVQPWSGSTLSFSGLMVAGTYDVFVVVYDSTGKYPLAVRILRSQTIPGALNGGNPVAFATSDETSKQTITYNNLPAGSSPYDPPYVYFCTSGGQELGLESFGMGTPATQYPALPAGAVQSGDYYIFDTSAPAVAAGGEVLVDVATANGGAQAITYPSPWTYSGPSPAALPTFNFDYSGFSGMSSITQYSQINWYLGTTSLNSIEISATGNYQNGATSLTIPDLSGLTGFLAPPSSGTNVEWDAIIMQGSAFKTIPPNGTVQGVQNSGEYAVP